MNYTEYLYHPQVYKKKECISSKLGSVCGQSSICPYYHKNENLADLMSLSKDLKPKVPLIEDNKETSEKSGIEVVPEVKNVEVVEKIIIEKEENKEQAKAGEVFNEVVEQGVKNYSGTALNLTLDTKGSSLEEAKAARVDQVDYSKSLTLPVSIKRYVYMQEFHLFEDRFNEFKECRGRSFDVTYACGLLANYVSAFLNTQGGTIYYGISDSGYISGVKLMRRTRDLFTQSFDGILNKFNPPVGPDLYSVSFSPIYSKEGGLMQELYVLEIGVKIGDKKRIYYTHKHFQLYHIL